VNFLVEQLGDIDDRFNSQPREGGWQFDGMEFEQDAISTHSRAKAAGGGLCLAACRSHDFAAKAAGYWQCFKHL
jgi:hypothetical protein